MAAGTPASRRARLGTVVPSAKWYAKRGPTGNQLHASSRARDQS